MKVRPLFFAVPAALALAFLPYRDLPSSGFPPKRMPLARILAELPPINEGRFGRPGDPLNMVFVGPREAVAGVLARAGWVEIDKRIAVSVLQGLEDLVSGKGLQRFPPMNNYRLWGRLQDFNFAQPVSWIASRHHFRLWKLPFLDDKGREIWWGSGDFDLRVRWSDLTHIPDPDTSMERDYIARTLKEAGVRLTWVALSQLPLSGENDKGYPFRTDGRVLLAEFTP